MSFLLQLWNVEFPPVPVQVLSSFRAQSKHMHISLIRVCKSALAT